MSKSTQTSGWMKCCRQSSIRKMNSNKNIEKLKWSWHDIQTNLEKSITPLENSEETLQTEYRVSGLEDKLEELDHTSE